MAFLSEIRLDVTLTPKLISGEQRLKNAERFLEASAP